MQAWEGGEDFQGLLKGDEQVRKYLDAAEIDAMFDMAYHVNHVDMIFDRVFP